MTTTFKFPNQPS